MERRKHIRVAHKVNAIPVTFSGDAKGTGTLYESRLEDVRSIHARPRRWGPRSHCDWVCRPRRTQSKLIRASLGWTIKDKYFGVKFLQVDPTDRIVLNTYLASRS